ncbi:MAG: phage integrase N-terminal SAM-like domain-containing protein, partial [Geminicoccaceae bacterium]
MTEKAIGPLRQRMIDDMTIRGLGQKTKDDYIRAVKNFARFFGASPDRARFEDLRRYQLHLRNQG